PPALLPVAIAFVVSAVETAADVSATCELSRVPTTGPAFASRIQRALAADALGSVLAALLTCSATVTFSQNNAVIALSRDASRRSAFCAALTLIALGVLGKVGALLAALPDPVLGGVATFLFGGVAAAGVRILARVSWRRRASFIVTAALALGFGVEMRPTALSSFLPHHHPRPAVDALRQAAHLVLSTGYAVGALTAALLNALLPPD
ncbi:unnamed protein product, partial [Agarophyton chilense]